MKMEKWKRKNLLLLIFCVIACVGICGCSGDDDEDSFISVCNWDNNEYEVQLHRTSDGTLMDAFHLEEWYDFGGDQCDEFKNFNGEFYLTIYEGSSESPTDTSSNFYIEENETEAFYIDSSGEIRRN